MKMFFYLQWLNKRPDKIKITDERPDDINYESNFRVKGKEYILCGNINEEFITYYPSPKLIYKKNHYLMSHLQKCVRRMEDIKAVKTAKHLIDLDIKAYLRRLPIIMLEDVTLHESLSIIIWLMIAESKGFTFKQEIIKWLLGIPYYLCHERIKTKYFKDGGEYNIDGTYYNEEITTILYALKFRRGYGGMEGDLRMIDYYMGGIIKGKIQIQKSKIPIIKLNISNLEINEWIYQANDFHCNRYILKKINDYHPNYNEEYIKKLIWEFSSSLNHREFVDCNVKRLDDWEKIRKTVKTVQKNCIYY